MNILKPLFLAITLIATVGCQQMKDVERFCDAFSWQISTNSTDLQIENLCDDYINSNGASITQGGLGFVDLGLIATREEMSSEGASLKAISALTDGEITQDELKAHIEAIPISHIFYLRSLSAYERKEVVDSVSYHLGLNSLRVQEILKRSHEISF